MSRLGVTAAVTVLMTVAALPLATAQAATYTVTTSADQTGVCMPGGPCSLRQAIDTVNQSASPPDQISVPAGTYALDPANGALTISSSVTITGAGARTTTVAQTVPADRSNSGDRVFDIAAGATVTISGLTITGGTAQQNNGFFGGDVRSAGNTTLLEDQITNGSAYSGGGVSNSSGTMVIDRTTVTGNAAPFGGGDSGGIQNFGSGATPGTLTVRNSTVALNSATIGGGIFSWSDTNPAAANVTTIENSTIALNSASGRGAPGGLLITAGTATVKNTIISGNTFNGAPSNCGGTTGASLGNDIESGSDCGFTAAGDLQNTDPQLGPLQDNGGQTDTLALPITSPAIDHGSLDCPPPSVDQRGVTRPQGPACDVGAFELAVIPITTPSTTPQTTQTTPPVTTTLPPPVQGVSANAVPVAGTVLVAVPAAAKASAARAPLVFIPLSKLGRQIPMGSTLDTTHGTVRLTMATNVVARTQSGNFSKGLFVVQQPRSSPLTTLTLTGAGLNACSKLPHGGAPRVVAAARRRTRTLVSNVHGRFRTRGRNSVATVRGTEFLTKDTCTGTITRVTRGVVVVRDLTKRRNVTLRHGQTYLARAPLH